MDGDALAFVLAGGGPLAGCVGACVQLCQRAGQGTAAVLRLGFCWSTSQLVCAPSLDWVSNPSDVSLSSRSSLLPTVSSCCRWTCEPQLLNSCLQNIGDLITGIGSAITTYAKASETLDRRAGNGVNTASVATKIAPGPRTVPTSIMLDPVTITPVVTSRGGGAQRSSHPPAAAAAAAAAAATLAAAEAVEAAEDAGGSAATLPVGTTPSPTVGVKRNHGTDGEEELNTSGKKKRIRKNWTAEEEERFMTVIVGEGRGLSDADLVKLLAVEFDGERTALQVSGHLKNLRNAKRI